MLTLNDGRSELWQWDTGRTLAVDADCSQVHLSNKVFGRSIDVDVVDGVAIIPDILLQSDNDLNVWAFVGTAENGYTKISKTFKVNRRNKPADYVFTPTDQMTLQTIQRQIGDLSDLTTEAKTNLVAAINEAARTGGGAGSIDLRVADGYVQYSRDGGVTWTNLIAMADLKGANGVTPHIGDNGHWYLGATDTGKPSRGEIGAPGKDGNPGAPGKDGAPGVYYGTTQPAGDTHPVWIDPDGGPDDGGLLPAVTDADNGKVLRVVSGEWAAADMPTGGTDMGITGAAVGQIAKITAVDASGVPTAWSPVDMPSGGGGLKLIAHLELTEDVTPTVSAWTSFADGEAFGTLKRIIFSGKIVGASVSTTEGAARPVLNMSNLPGCPYVGQKAGNKRWWMCEIDIGEHFSKIKSSLSNAIPPNSTTTFSWSLNAPVYFLQQEIQSIGLNFLSSTATGFGPGTDLYVWGEKA